MLNLLDITIMNEGLPILHKCNCKLNSQSIIVADNNTNTNVIARTLNGSFPLNEGEIHLDDKLLSQEEKRRKKLFFVIEENYSVIWKNYRLYDIPKLIKINQLGSILFDKYHIDPLRSFESLSKFHQLIYLISIGQLLDRKIFIFEQPTKYFDYKDMDQFYKFLTNDFVNSNYIILSNRFEEMFTKLSVPIYKIASNKLVELKGGEHSNDSKQKKKVEI